MYTDQLASICSRPLGSRSSHLLEGDQLLPAENTAFAEDRRGSASASSSCFRYSLSQHLFALF